MKTNEVDMLDEYDFSKGIRGKYAKEYKKGSNVIILEPEVSEEFPTSESVNEALKYLVKIINNHKNKSINKVQ